MLRLFTVTSVTLALALVLQLPSLGQSNDPKPKSLFKVVDPEYNRTTPDKVSLGKELFESTLLSRNRKISCATCHDPAGSFVDGFAQSHGVFDTEVGRNTPTLVVVDTMPGFRGAPRKRTPAVAGDAVSFEFLDLEARCLTPIENPIEMGSTVKEAITALRAAPGMSERFDAAFGSNGPGVSAERLGRALAAFLRSLEPSDSPFKEFLAGNRDAMSDEELRGLKIFNDRGQCTSCHKGPALTDGLFHVSLAPSSFRGRLQDQQAQDRAAALHAKAADATSGASPSSNPLAPRSEPSPAEVANLAHRQTQSGAQGGYDGRTTPRTGGITQTPTLWDVARTSPYFRDGSVQDLETAVRQHIAELRDVTAAISASRGQSASTMAGCGIEPFTPDEAFTALPAQLRPRIDRAFQQIGPANLADAELQDVLLFLKSLSPKPQSRGN